MLRTFQMTLVCVGDVVLIHHTTPFFQSIKHPLFASLIIYLLDVPEPKHRDKKTCKFYNVSDFESHFIISSRTYNLLRDELFKECYI